VIHYYTESSYVKIHSRTVISSNLYILRSELSRRTLSPTLATTHYSCPDNSTGLVELSGYVKLASGGSWAEIFTQTWQLCHSWGSKMAAAGVTVGYRLRRPKITPVSLTRMVTSDLPSIYSGHWCPGQPGKLTKDPLVWFE